MTSGVSIVLATYNRAHLILETLVSIQNQTYSNWECLIIDDGGTDNTSEVIEQILKYDSRFKFYKRPENYQKGLPGCRNFGLDLAKGDYILFFDDDDIVHPQNLEIALQGIEKEGYDFCLYQKQSFTTLEKFSFQTEVLNNVQKVNKKDLEKIISNEMPMASCTVLWNKKAIGNQRFNKQLLYAEEWEFYTRLIANGLEGISISNILYFNRKHLQSNTGEFYSNNPVRKASKKMAIELMVKNLHDQAVLSQSILRYLIQLSLDYKEYQLFQRILELVNLSTFEKLKWTIFYTILPYRLKAMRFKKNIFK